MKPVSPLLLALPLLVLPPMTMSGCASTRTIGEKTDDAIIKSRVGRRLTADPEVSRYKIDIDVMDAVVTLRGEVDSQATADEAVELAEGTKGVRKVNNKLMIASEVERDPQARGDFAIKSEVGSRLRADPEIRRLNVDVDVVNGVVYLSGVVHDQPARDTAERLASEVEGVRRVENELQVSEQDSPISEDADIPDEAEDGAEGDVTKKAEGEAEEKAEPEDAPD